MRIILNAKIEKLEEKFLDRDWQKSDNGPTYTRQSRGWFVQFEGSTESIQLFTEKPIWNVGDNIQITFERAPS